MSNKEDYFIHVAMFYTHLMALPWWFLVTGPVCDLYEEDLKAQSRGEVSSLALSSSLLFADDVVLLALGSLQFVHN